MTVTQKEEGPCPLQNRFYQPQEALQWLCLLSPPPRTHMASQPPLLCPGQIQSQVGGEDTDIPSPVDSAWAGKLLEMTEPWALWDV